MLFFLHHDKVQYNQDVNLKDIVCLIPNWVAPHRHPGSDPVGYQVGPCSKNFSEVKCLRLGEVFGSTEAYGESKSFRRKDS